MPTYIDEFLLLPLLLGSTSLVLKDNIVIPPPLDAEISLVQ